MARHIIYIINPISGTRTKKDLQEFIEKKTAEKKIPFQVFPSVASGDYSFLHAVIKEQKITDVVIAGGDGTVSQVINSLMDCNVNFGIIPCGSGNGLGICSKNIQTTGKALEVIFNGTPSDIDGFYINNQFACMLCGIGFDAKVAHEFAGQPKRGLTTYETRLVRKTFLLLNHIHFQLKVNGLQFSTEAYFISIANSNQFGNNFTIAPKALLADGLLDIVIAKNNGKTIMYFSNYSNKFWEEQTAKEAYGSSLKKPVIYFQTEKIKIENAFHMLRCTLMATLLKLLPV